jgi:vacuolar-type H+-ATPase subunit I/STV1
MNTEEIIVYVAIGLLYVFTVGMIISLVSDAIITDRKKDHTLRIHAARLQWLEDMSNYYDGDVDEAIEDMVDKPGYEWLKDYKNV